MKKFMLISFLVLVPVIYSNAQFGIGIKGGVNLNTFSVTNTADDFKNYTGYHLGAFVVIPISSAFQLMPEFLWEARGAKFESTFGGGSQTEKLNYISVPVLVRWRPIGLISLHTGPHIGFLTKAELEGDDVSDFFNSVDFSWDFGAEVHLPLKIKGGIRYVLGINNISDFEDEDKSNRVWQIYAAWTVFGKDKKKKD